MRSCMTCRHQGMQYCPFHKGYTGWDDVYCNKWESKEDDVALGGGGLCTDEAPPHNQGLETTAREKDE